MRETAWILNSLFKFKPSAKLERIIREFRLCLEPLLILAWKTCCGNNYKWIWHDCTWHLKNHHLVFFPIKSFATDSASVRDSSRFWGWCSGIWSPGLRLGSEHYEGSHSGAFTSTHRDSILFCERCCAFATFAEHTSELEKPESPRGVNGIGITHHLSNDAVASNLSHGVSAESTRTPHLACFSSSCNHLPIQKIKQLYFFNPFIIIIIIT